jgi:hypothetical protein
VLCVAIICAKFLFFCVLIKICDAIKVLWRNCSLTSLHCIALGCTAASNKPHSTPLPKLTAHFQIPVFRHRESAFWVVRHRLGLKTSPYSLLRSKSYRREHPLLLYYIVRTAHDIAGVWCMVLCYLLFVLPLCLYCVAAISRAANTSSGRRCFSEGESVVRDRHWPFTFWHFRKHCHMA